MYFLNKLDTVKIAEKLKITKQAVSKVLKINGQRNMKLKKTIG